MPKDCSSLMLIAFASSAKPCLSTCYWSRTKGTTHPDFASNYRPLCYSNGPACVPGVTSATEKAAVRMKILEWNVNHRTRQKPIRPTMAAAILSLRPDVVVLTEYVSGFSRGPFLDELASGGLAYHLVSPDTKAENQVLIVARSILEEGEIRAPAIASSLPSNVLHVRVPAEGFEVLGLRMPDYSRLPPIRRDCWDWLTQTASALVSRPFVLIGDFNTDPKYPKARCGPRIAELVAGGWKHAAPSGGASYWTPTGHAVRIDHAFVSRHFAILSARYIRESGPHVFAGGGDGALSDHAALIVDLQWKKEKSPGDKR